MTDSLLPSFATLAFGYNDGSILFGQGMQAVFQFSTGYYSGSRILDQRCFFRLSTGFTNAQGRFAFDRTILKKAAAGGGSGMAVILQNAFQDDYMGYGNIRQTVNLLFKRRAYFTATIYF